MSDSTPGNTPPDGNPSSAAEAMATESPRPEVLRESRSAPRRRSISWLALAGGCLSLFVIGCFLVGIAALIGAGESPLPGGSRVAVVAVEGEIVDARDIVEAIVRHRNDDSIKALVIRINSPGGEIAPSQEIFAEIRRTRGEGGKPVVASLDSIAASGGYYVAAACDSIVSNPGSLTGSIGVIAQWMNTEDLMRWAHVRPETITSGSMKDAGSPYRPLSDSERAYFQALAAQLHQQFVGAVFTGRSGKIGREELQRVSDGRVFTGQQALELKLVDELGTLNDAIRSAGKLAGLSGEPEAVYPRRERDGLLGLLLGSRVADGLTRVVSADAIRPRLQFHW